MAGLATAIVEPSDMIARDKFIQSLMDLSPEGLIVVSPSGEILAFSRAASALLGYGRMEAIGRNVSILMPHPDGKEHDNNILAYLKTGTRKIIGVERQVMARHKDGREVPVHLLVGEATIGDQRLFLGFIEDLSEKVEQQRKIAKLSSDLAHASRVRSMSMLASAIAHELNQPLTSIQNYVETIASILEGGGEIDQAVLRETMSECAMHTTRASEIIRRFRLFMAKGEVETSIESLSSLVSEALALALADGEGKNVEVRNQLDPALDAVLVDPIEIQQVVFNLARNAKQAAVGRKQLLLQIASMPVGSMVEVTIEDDGPGLDDDRLAQLIQPFVSGKADGMGMGLSICQTIIEGHGGRFWATRSGLGGAAFHFTIPRMVPEGTQAP
ncbi:MAG: nitrogen regulation protein NR(II) [Novosphingobium sp.]